MTGTLRIGRLFGIDIGIDWSWGLVFLLMSWNLTVVFHSWHPGWPVIGCLLLAIVAALLFFSSVLAHELAHAVVAQSFGMKVREIRLFLFGGVSNIEREPPSPKAEFWMAIVGPLMSFALGFVFIVLASFALPRVDAASPWDTLASLGPVATLFFWLGPVNILVGAFNLIPGFPLDGGRVLRAAVWRATGDLHKATLAASTAGRVIGWALVALGIAMVFGARVPVFGRGAGGGVWLAFIGWFLASAATRSYGALVLKEVLEGVRVSQLMRRSGWVVPPETSVRRAVDEWFMRSSEHAFPVVTDGVLLGLVCVGDVRKLSQEAWDRTPVQAIMTPRESLSTVAPDDPAEDALRRLGELDVDQLPVLDGERLVGMVARRDIARWLELNTAPPRAIGMPRTA